MQANNKMQVLNERELVTTRIFDAPRELVWKAWAEPAHIARWWGPQGYSVPSCELDFKVGGRFHLQMRSPDGTVYPADGFFREIVEPERIVIEGMAEDSHPCGGGLPPRAIITVTFTLKGDKTLLTIHTRFESAERLKAANDNGYSVSWEACLERLGEYLRVST